MNLDRLLTILLSVWLLAFQGAAASQQVSPNYDYDGTYLVGITGKGSTGADATVWNAQDGSAVLRVSHEESVVRVQLAPSGSALLTSSFLPSNELGILSKDNSIRIWDLPSGKQVLRIPNATYGQFSRDGKRVYGFSKRADSRPNGGTFNLSAWDAKTGKRLFTAEIPFGGTTLSSTYTLHESVGSRRLLYYGSGSAAVFDSMTGKQIAEPVRAFAAFSVEGLITPKGDEAVVAEIRHVRYFSTATGSEIKKVIFPIESAWFVGLHPTGQGFAAVTVYGDLAYYDRTSDRIIQAKSDIKSPHSLHIRSDGSRFYVFSGGGYADGAPIPQVVTAFNPATCARVWQSPGRLIACSEDQLTLLEWPTRISIVDAISGARKRQFNLRGVDASGAVSTGG